MKEAIESLPKEKRDEWDQLTFVGESVAHPLIYPHPITSEQTMAFHCGAPFCRTFAKNFNPKTGEAEETYDTTRTAKMIDTI